MRTQSGKERRRHRRTSHCSSDRCSSGDSRSDCSSLSSSSSSCSDSAGQLYWDISLDPDLLQTIAHFYPQWFAGSMADSGLGSPRAVVDDASIQKAMDKNKESLKVKLLLRRPIGQLVEQGILPRKSPTHSFLVNHQHAFLITHL